MTNRTWNLRDLRNAVLKKHGKKVYVELSPCLNSIVERQEYARFHFHEAKASLEAFFKSDHSESDLFRLVFGKGGDGLEDYEDSKFRAQAHTVACLQSLHSVLDILSHVIYFALNMSAAKRSRDISVWNVIAWLDECESQKSLVIMLRDLTGHEGYSYLNAIVNHSKHKSLISPSFRFNLGDKGKEKKEFILPAFRYGNKSYQPRLAYEFLTSEFDRQSDFVIKIGNEINRVVNNPC